MVHCLLGNQFKPCRIWVEQDIHWAIVTHPYLRLRMSVSGWS